MKTQVKNVFYLLQVVSFDGSTTIQEFLLTLGRSLGVQDCSRSGFALFSDDPRGGEVEACLQNHIKVGFICCLLTFQNARLLKTISLVVPVFVVLAFQSKSKHDKVSIFI